MLGKTQTFCSVIAELKVNVLDSLKKKFFFF